VQGIKKQFNLYQTRIGDLKSYTIGLPAKLQLQSLMVYGCTNIMHSQLKCVHAIQCQIKTLQGPQAFWYKKLQYTENVLFAKTEKL
jgi:hypothetical protein